MQPRRIASAHLLLLLWLVTVVSFSAAAQITGCPGTVTVSQALHEIAISDNCELLIQGSSTKTSINFQKSKKFTNIGVTIRGVKFRSKQISEKNYALSAQGNQFIQMKYFIVEDCTYEYNYAGGEFTGNQGVGFMWWWASAPNFGGDFIVRNNNINMNAEYTSGTRSLLSGYTFLQEFSLGNFNSFIFTGNQIYYKVRTSGGTMALWHGGGNYKFQHGQLMNISNNTVTLDKGVSSHFETNCGWGCGETQNINVWNHGPIENVSSYIVSNNIVTAKVHPRKTGDGTATGAGPLRSKGTVSIFLFAGIGTSALPVGRLLFQGNIFDVRVFQRQVSNGNLYMFRGGNQEIGTFYISGDMLVTNNVLDLHSSLATERESATSVTGVELQAKLFFWWRVIRIAGDTLIDDFKFKLHVDSAIHPLKTLDFEAFTWQNVINSPNVTVSNIVAELARSDNPTTSVLGAEEKLDLAMFRLGWRKQDPGFVARNVKSLVFKNVKLLVPAPEIHGNTYATVRAVVFWDAARDVSLNEMDANIFDNVDSFVMDGVSIDVNVIKTQNCNFEFLHLRHAHTLDSPLGRGINSLTMTNNILRSTEIKNISDANFRAAFFTLRDLVNLSVTTFVFSDNTMSIALPEGVGDDTAAAEAAAAASPETTKIHCTAQMIVIEPDDNRTLSPGVNPSNKGQKQAEQRRNTANIKELRMTRNTLDVDVPVTVPLQSRLRETEMLVIESWKKYMPYSTTVRIQSLVFESNELKITPGPDLDDTHSSISFVNFSFPDVLQLHTTHTVSDDWQLRYNKLSLSSSTGLTQNNAPEVTVFGLRAASVTSLKQLTPLFVNISENDLNPSGIFTKHPARLARISVDGVGGGGSVPPEARASISVCNNNVAGKYNTEKKLPSILNGFADVALPCPGSQTVVKTMSLSNLGSLSEPITPMPPTKSRTISPKSVTKPLPPTNTSAPTLSPDISKSMTISARSPSASFATDTGSYNATKHRTISRSRTGETETVHIYRPYVASLLDGPVADAVAVVGMITQNPSAGVGIARMKRMMKLSQACGAATKRAVPDAAASPMQWAFGDDDDDLAPYRGMCLGNGFFLFLFLVAFLILSWLSAFLARREFDKGMRIARVPGVVAVPIALLASDTSSAMCALIAFTSTFTTKDIMAIVVACAFTIAIPMLCFVYLIRLVRRSELEVQPVVVAASKGDGSDKTDDDKKQKEYNSIAGPPGSSSSVLSPLFKAWGWMMDNLTLEWPETMLLQRWGLFFEMAVSPVFMFWDMAVSWASGLAEGSVDGPAEQSRCLAVSGFCIALFVVHLGIVAWKKPWLSRYDTFMSWSNTLCALVGSTLNLLLHLGYQEEAEQGLEIIAICSVVIGFVGLLALKDVAGALKDVVEIIRIRCGENARGSDEGRRRRENIAAEESDDDDDDDVMLLSSPRFIVAASSSSPETSSNNNNNNNNDSWARTGSSQRFQAAGGDGDGDGDGRAAAASASPAKRKSRRGVSSPAASRRQKPKQQPASSSALAPNVYNML